MTPDETTEDIDEVRSTAPQSPFTGRDVAIGFGVLLLGIGIAFAVPYLGTL